MTDAPDDRLFFSPDVRVVNSHATDKAVTQLVIHDTDGLARGSLSTDGEVVTWAPCGTKMPATVPVEIARRIPTLLACFDDHPDREVPDDD